MGFSSVPPKLMPTRHLRTRPYLDVGSSPKSPGKLRGRRALNPTKGLGFSEEASTDEGEATLQVEAETGAMCWEAKGPRCWLPTEVRRTQGKIFPSSLRRWAGGCLDFRVLTPGTVREKRPLFSATRLWAFVTAAPPPPNKPPSRERRQWFP